MKETRNILGWLGMANEVSIMQDALKHIEETCKTVTHFADAVKAFIGGDLSAKTVAIEKVRQSEHEADLIRARMIGQLTEGLLMPPDREDLMDFTKTLDKIADWTNGAARLLGFLDVKLPDVILKNISISTDLIVQSVEKLEDAIRAMSRNDFKKTIEDCDEVDRLEHDADEQKRAFIDVVIHTPLEPTSLLLLYHLAETLEGVTDKVEAAAHHVRRLAVKSK